MTTAYRSSKLRSAGNRTANGNTNMSLLSPLMLLVLLAILFTFFLTASGQSAYAKNPDAEVIYKNVVTNGDAIRSVLQ